MKDMALGQTENRLSMSSSVISAKGVPADPVARY
jgi:hypothetical protein